MRDFDVTNEEVKLLGDNGFVFRLETPHVVSYYNEELDVFLERRWTFYGYWYLMPSKSVRSTREGDYPLTTGKLQVLLDKLTAYKHGNKRIEE